MVVLAFSKILELGFEHVLDISRIGSVQFAVPRSNETEISMGFSNFSEIVVKCGEVEELADDGAFDGRVRWVPYGFPEEARENEERGSEEEKHKGKGYEDEDGVQDVHGS